jgi:recombination protein RecA
VAARVPRQEIDGDMGDSHVGLQARLMSQAMRKLSGAIAKSNCVVIFINQLREKVGVMYGNPEVTPGGRALKFYASVRIEIRKVESLKNGSEVYGNRVRCKVVKNKVAPPFKTAEFDILYGRGICKSAEVLDIGIKLGVLEKSGSWISYNGQRIGQGKDKARAYLESDAALMREVEEKVMEKYRAIDPDEGVDGEDGEEDFDLREFDGGEE